MGSITVKENTKLQNLEFTVNANQQFYMDKIIGLQSQVGAL